MFLYSYNLPIHNFIENLLLFRTAPVEIDAGGFDAFMAENIGKHRDIATLFDEIFGKQVPEGMGMYDRGIEIVYRSEMLQLSTDAGGGDAVTEAVKKNIAGGTVDASQPF